MLVGRMRPDTRKSPDAREEHRGVCFSLKLSSVTKDRPIRHRPGLLASSSEAAGALAADVAAAAVAGALPDAASVWAAAWFAVAAVAENAARQDETAVRYAAASLALAEVPAESLADSAAAPVDSARGAEESSSLAAGSAE